MLLQCDEQTRNLSGGHVGEAFEHAIEQVSEQQATAEIRAIYGTTFMPQQFLVTQEQAMNIAFAAARKYWGTIDESMENNDVDIKWAQDKLDSFFYSQSGKESLLAFLEVHHHANVYDIIQIIFGVECVHTISATGLHKIYAYKIGEHYVVQVIYEEIMPFCYALLAKKIYAILLYKPLKDIYFINSLLSDFEHAVYQSQPQVTNFHDYFQNILKKIIDYVNERNGSSIPKKQMQLYQLVFSTKRLTKQPQQVLQLITQFHNEWRYAMVPLTETEEVLLACIRLRVAVHNEEFEKIISLGEYLLEDDRLNDNGVKILVDYNEVLPNFPPATMNLVKRYDQNYLTYLCYVLVHAYIMQKDLAKAYALIWEDETASCELIHNLLRIKKPTEKQLSTLNLIVEQNIAQLVGEKERQKALAIWQSHYLQNTAPYYLAAKQTSRHITHLIQVFAYAEHEQLFLKMLELYKSYFRNPQQDAVIHQFLQDYLSEQS